MKSNKSHQISIANDFSTEPLGRFPSDSDTNGTLFRENFLVPALSKYDFIQVNLDSTEGYGSSFLEEAFGGLVRKHDLASSELLRRITFISNDDPTLISEIQKYINDADNLKTINAETR